MGNLCNPFIPMFVHEVVDNTSSCERQSFKESGILVVGCYRRTDDDMFLIRRYHETAYTAGKSRHALRLTSFCTYAEYLRFGGILVMENIGNTVAIVKPDRTALRCVGACQTLHVSAVNIHDVKVTVRRVVGYALITYSENNLFAIRRNLRIADTSESLKNFRRHHSVDNLNFGSGEFVISAVSTTRKHHGKNQGSQSNTTFFHYGIVYWLEIIDNGFKHGELVSSTCQAISHLCKFKKKSALFMFSLTEKFIT